MCVCGGGGGEFLFHNKNVPLVHNIVLFSLGGVNL